MRIGFFTDTYLPVTNGICYVIEIMRRDLERAGHEVWVVAPRDIRWHLPKEEKIIRYPALGGLFYEDQFNSVFLPRRELKRIKELKLDLIMAFTPSVIGAFGAYCADKLSIPYVIQYGTDLELYAEMYKPAVAASILGSSVLAPYMLGMGAKETGIFWKGYFQRSQDETYSSSVSRHMIMQLHKHSDLVVATSEKIADKLNGWPIKQKVTVIPTGVDALPEDKHFQEYFSKKHGLKKSDEIILYAGRMSAEKNLELLIDAFNLLAVRRPKAQLLMVGDFQHRWRLEQKADQTVHGDRINFIGRVDRSELGSIYPLAKVFAFPSLTDCQALVLNEAAHAGVPLVWCDSESLNPVLVDGQTGLRADNDEKDLADKLEKIISSPALAKKLGAGAKSRAKLYTESKQTRKLASQLQKLIK